MGNKHIEWTKEVEDKFLEEIAKGKTYVQLSVAMGIGVTYLYNKLLDMGFEGLKDARDVLIG